MPALYRLHINDEPPEIWLACRDDLSAWQPGGQPIHEMIGLDPESFPDAYATCARYLEGLVTLSEATAVLQWAADGDSCEPLAVQPVALPLEPRRMLRDLFEAEPVRTIGLQSFGLTLTAYKQGGSRCDM